MAAPVAGDGQWQGANGCGLVDDHQHGAVLGLQLTEELAEFGFGVGQPGEGWPRSSCGGSRNLQGIVRHEQFT